MKTLAAVAMCLMSTGCGSSATKRTFDIRPAALETAVRSIMAEYSSVKETPGIFTTGWEEEPLSAFGTTPTPGARYLRARYDVRLAGNEVEVDARAEMFFSRGPLSAAARKPAKLGGLKPVTAAWRAEWSPRRPGRWS